MARKSNIFIMIMRRMIILFKSSFPAKKKNKITLDQDTDDTMLLCMHLSYQIKTREREKYNNKNFLNEF